MSERHVGPEIECTCLFDTCKGEAHWGYNIGAVNAQLQINGVDPHAYIVFDLERVEALIASLEELRALMRANPPSEPTQAMYAERRAQDGRYRAEQRV